MLHDEKKCPKCGKDMVGAGDNETRQEKEFFCFDCDIWILVLPNGLEVIRDM